MNRKEPNLCVRFKLADRARVQITAAEQNLPISTWVRETILVRAERVIAHRKVSPLIEYSRPRKDSEQICIRFRESDFNKIKHAAALEKCLPSTWIRAVVINALQDENQEEACCMKPFNTLVDKMSPKRQASINVRASRMLPVRKVNDDGWTEAPEFRTFDKTVGVFRLSVMAFPKRRYVTWIVETEAIADFECATGKCTTVDEAKGMAMRMARHLELFT